MTETLQGGAPGGMTNVKCRSPAATSAARVAWLTCTWDTKDALGSY